MMIYTIEQVLAVHVDIYLAPMGAYPGHYVNMTVLLWMFLKPKLT